jgi:hypothetical protein
MRNANGKILRAAAMLAAAIAMPSYGSPISYTSTSSATVSQNFDSLPSSGSATAWTNDSTLPAWSLFVSPAPGTAAPTILPGDGSSNTGSFNSFGTVGSTDRALGGTGSGGAYFGSPASGAVAGWMAVAITNATGGTLNSFSVHYDGEQWRNGGNTSAQTMVEQFGFGSSFTAVPTWTNTTFDFTSPTIGATAAALDGNAAANRVANIGGTISSLNWANGDTLWVRWIENNDAGNDHGLGLDNFTFSATGTQAPEPVSIGLLALAAIFPYTRRRRTL